MVNSSRVLVSLLVWTSAGVALADAKLLDFTRPRVPHQYIVRLKDGTVATRDFFREAGVKPLHSFASSPAYLVEAKGDDESAVLEALQNNPEVAFIQANRIFTISNTPNDPNFAAQYHHQKISSPTAWDTTTGSAKILVGIIDTGVNYKHPDIAPNYWTNPGESGLDAQGQDKSTNGVDDDSNGFVDDFRGWDFVNNDNDPFDDNGHGTHTSGIIGAKGNNGQGVAGIAWDVSLVGLKIFGKDGSGDLATAVQAIEYATKIGITITNNSWGGEVDALPGAEDEDLLRDAIAAASAKGYLFVAAAGNSSSNNDKKPTVPASYKLPNIISVAATSGADKLSFYSNYGVDSVDIAAPGSNILSTVLGDGLSKLTGTSMAAPVVTGAAVLVKALHPELDAVGIKARLLASGDQFASLKNRVRSGARLNVAKALID